MLTINLPQGGAQPTSAGQMSMSDAEELFKALSAGYGTDSSTFTGGTALRIQSLDKTMKSTIQENEDFVLFNMLQKSGAGATVDEWTERSGIGGFLGGTTNSELGNIATQQGAYDRQTAQVKYLMTQCQVSFVATLGNNIAPAKAVEAQAGALRLLTDAEYLSFYGDSAVNPFEFDGIFTQLRNAVTSGYMDSTHMIDLNGAPLTDITAFNQGARSIGAYGNFGKASDFFCSYEVQSDMDSSFLPAWRVPLTGAGSASIEMGTPVEGIRTSFGDIKSRKDVFVVDEPQLAPFEARVAEGLNAVAAANAALAPSAISIALASAASSTFTAARAGNYYYMVCGLNAAGQSTGVVSGQEAITAGEAATITISRSAGGAETGYAIYRTPQNAGKTLVTTNDNFRLIKRIPCAGATTIFVDDNTTIPGSVMAAMVSMRKGQDNISWRQLLPMTEFPLYPTQQAVIPWAQLLFGYLRIAKRKQNVLYKNVIPSSSNWKPFAPGVS